MSPCPPRRLRRRALFLSSRGDGTHASAAQAAQAAASAASFPRFKAAVKVGSKSYTYVIADKDPAKKAASASATAHVDLAPLIMKFSMETRGIQDR